RQQHELAVTADAILRSAHYDHHATRYTAWGLRPVQNTDQALALRLDADRLLGIQAPGLARHSTVASSSGGTTATSGVDQKGSPSRYDSRTWIPRARISAIVRCVAKPGVLPPGPDTSSQSQETQPPAFK